MKSLNEVVSLSKYEQLLAQLNIIKSMASNLLVSPGLGIYESDNFVGMLVGHVDLEYRWEPLNSNFLQCRKK